MDKIIHALALAHAEYNKRIVRRKMERLFEIFSKITKKKYWNRQQLSLECIHQRMFFIQM